MTSRANVTPRPAHGAYEPDACKDWRGRRTCLSCRDLSARSCSGALSGARSAVDSSLLRTGLIAFGVMALLAAVAALAILWWLHRRLEPLRIARDAELADTLRRVPLLLVVALDLLDMSLNVFAAPFVWVFLNRYGWAKLRNLATAAAALPGTQFLPVLTIAWLIARITERRSVPSAGEAGEGAAPR